MSLLRYIRDNQRNEDGSYTVTHEQMRTLRRDAITLRRLAWKLMREFKRRADVQIIYTKWVKPYRAMKAYFKDRTK